MTLRFLIIVSLFSLSVCLPAWSAKPAAASYSIASPMPTWVQPLADIPDTQRTEPVVVRLAETQVHVDTVTSVLVNRAIQVNDRSALKQIGQYGISYNPAYQKLQLHRVALLRDGQLQDRTNSVNVRLLQREEKLESNVYGGEATLQLLLEDVRLGDTLWLTYSTLGENPVFSPRWSDTYSWDIDQPIALRRLTVLHPIQRNIQWQQLGDFHEARLTPHIDQIGTYKRLRFEGKDLEPVAYEPSTPTDYLGIRLLAFTEYQNWQQVARWAHQLFPKTRPSPALVSLAKRFDKASPPPERAAAALRWVQNEIRYFSVSLGQNSHRPQTPEVVLRRRYGDCKDKSQLLIALLGELGIAARPVLLSAQAPKLPGKAQPSPQWFDHAIVEIQLPGRNYYVDPTRTGQASPLDRIPTAISGAMALIVDNDSTRLTALPESTPVGPLYEHIDTLTLTKPEADASLEARLIYRGGHADWARVTFPAMSAGELKKSLLSLYEKTYPGIQQQSSPTLQDHPAQNHFEITARYTLPKPTTTKDGRHYVAYNTQIIKDSLAIPAKLVRNFPLAIRMANHHTRYRFNLQWPETIRTNALPVIRVANNPYFEMREEYLQQGNLVSYLLDYQGKADTVAAPSVPELQAQADRLEEFGSGAFGMSTDDFQPSPLANDSYRELDLARNLARLGRTMAAINPKDSKTIDYEKVCDDLILFLQLSDYHMDGLTMIGNALRDELRQARQRPGAQRCLARLAFAQGTHPESRDLFLASGTQPDDSMATRELAWSYYYAGDTAQALAAISRYRQGQTVAKQGGWQAHALLDTIALYQRSHHPLPAEVLQQASSIPDGPWPRPILAMQVGILTPDDLLKLTSKLPADARAIALTEAYYYIGQHHLAANQTEQARAALLRIGVEGIRSSAVYQQAKVELDRLTPTSTAFQAAMSALKDKRYDQALPVLRKEAETGLARAQLALGNMHEYGIGVPKDQTEALRWYQMAAAQNVAEAQNRLAFAYESGAGIAQDDAKAIEWLQRAAQLGDPHAQYNLAYRHSYGDGIAQNREQALHWYRQAAEQGFAAAQAALGYRYREGQVLPKDSRLALQWSQRASSGGDPGGKYLLGYHYFHGLNVDTDLAKALQLYRASAELGYGLAQFALAHSLETGLGIKPDQVEALKWYEAAAKNNVVGAHSAIVRVRLLFGIGSKQELIAAIQLLEQQAEKGESEAQFSLAAMLEQGYGVKPNQALANTYYQRAAEQGYNLAMRRMARAYHDGEGLSQDMTKAMVWYKKLAEQGLPADQLELAALYHFSKEHTPDYALAAQWYQKAADQGDPLAQNNLGDLYEKGQGVAQDLAKARALYLKSAKQYQAIAFQSLGNLYEQGLLGQPDLVLAWAYYHIEEKIRAPQDPPPKDGHTARLTPRLSAAELAAARQLANWQPGQPLPCEMAPKAVAQ